MSEPIPESIPTSADPRSRRPIKRARGANTATATQANIIDNLFFDPDRPVQIPELSKDNQNKSSTLNAPPEIVANVQGSSAGAGSGEFHVYKASRRREYERLRVMDEEAKKEEEDEKWAREERERKERDDEKTRKNREKRNKKKAKKGGKDGGGTMNGVDGDGADIKSGGVKKPLQIQRRGSAASDEGTGKSDFGVADVLKENGITIHDDD